MEGDQGSGTAEHDEPAVPERGMSWTAMLGWIGLAFVLAGLVAWRLVTPFFHHG